MNTRTLALSLLGMLCMMINCGRIVNPTPSLFKWQPLDKEFDSVADQMDYNYLRLDTFSTRDYKRLREAFFKSENQDELQHRMKYWEAREAFLNGGNKKKVRNILNEALALVDSAKYPYDHARMRFFEASVMIESPYEKYVMINECRKVFNSLSDSLYIALCDVLDGNLMTQVENFPASVDYYSRAIRTFSNIGLGTLTPRVIMNLAVSYHVMGKNKEANKLLSGLLNEPSIMDNPILREMLFANKYRVTDSLVYLRQAFAINNNNYEHRIFKVLENIEFAEHAIRFNQFDTATLFLERVKEGWNMLSDMEDQVRAEQLFLAHSIQKGNLQEAQRYFRSYTEKSDSLKRRKNINNINNIEFQRNIEAYVIREAQTEEKRKMTMIITGAVTFILFSIFGIGLFLYRAKIRRQKNEVEQRLLRSREALATVRLHQQNTDSMLANLETQMDKVTCKANDMEVAVSQIKQQIKLHKANNKEWDFLLEKFESIHPEFEQRMRKHYPTLTKKQIDFAGYIALGLSSRQIGAIMSIDVASVNTSRYRLRTKMGLEKGQVLEDEILNIVSSC